MNEEQIGGKAGDTTASTPNPLNSTQTTPKEQSTEKTITSPVETIPTEPSGNATETIQTEPSNNPVEAIQTNPVAEKTEIITETANPVDQPMMSTTQIEAAEAAAKAEEDKKKKKKKGLIIGLICGFVVLVGGIIGTLFALGVFKPADPVVVAMTKLFEGAKPDNIKLNGSLKITPKDTMIVRNLSISFDSAIKYGSMINATSVNVDAETAMGKLSLSADEVYATTNEIFIKLSGIEDISKFIATGLTEEIQYNTTTTEDTDLSESNDCLEAESETDCLSSTESLSTESMNSFIMAYILQILEVVDGEWVRIPLDEIGSTGLTINADTECLFDTYNALSSKGNLISEIYKRNSFIASTDEELQVAKKTNPIYKLVFDAEKTASFSNEVKNSNIIPKNCSSNQADISANEIEKSIKTLPDIYVEINDKHDFTRLYSNFTTEEGAKVEMDLDLSYPATIDVAEPIEYTDLESVFQSLMMDYTEAEGLEATV